jgi:pimeloyl-ACP methyl ester carboxylesterase
MIKNFSQLFFHSPEKLSAEFNIWNLSLGLAASAYATIQCAVELRDADLRKDLGSIQTPTLILHGTDDRLCSLDLGMKMNESIKGSKLIAIENAGHGFCYEERERVNSELVRFIG